MALNTSRRNFIRGMAGAGALTAAGGCFSIGCKAMTSASVSRPWA